MLKITTKQLKMADMLISVSVELCGEDTVKGPFLSSEL